MKKQSNREDWVTLEVQVPQELAQGVQAMAKLKQLSPESLIYLWLEDGLEKDELRFERLLLFAEMIKELNEDTLQILAKIKTKYFDERHDGPRELDSYMVKSQNINHLYAISVNHVYPKKRSY